MPHVSIIGMFCEDVREETRGSMTLVGVYPDNMNVPAIPGSFPKLCVYVRIAFDPEIDPGPLSLKLVSPSGEELTVSEVDQALVSKARDDAQAVGAPLVGIISIIKTGMLKIDKPGRLVVRANLNGEEFTCAALNIQETPKNSGAA